MMSFKSSKQPGAWWSAFLRVGLLGAAAVLLYSAAAYAQWCPTPIEPCDPTDPTSKCYKPTTPDCECKGYCQKSPCYVATGAYHISATDLQIRAPGPPLVASRNYTSTHAIDGPLGFGWQSSLTARLYYAAYLFAAPSTYRMEADIVMPDGSLYKFRQNTDGTFTPPVTRHDTLTKLPGGSFELVLQRTRSRLNFSSTGLLTSQVDEYGTKLWYYYDASGKLQQVAETSHSGRYINVFWGTDGRIQFLVDSDGRQVDFKYENGVLTEVTDPVDRKTSYEYNKVGRFSLLLTKILDPWGREVSVVGYDDKDRVETYTEDGEEYTYHYPDAANPGVTRKTDSSGNEFIYPFSAAGFVTGVTPPSGGGLPTESAYNADGSIQYFIDGVGVKTSYTYLSDGRPATVIRDDGGPQAVKFVYTYDLTFPTKLKSVKAYVPGTPPEVEDRNWQAWEYDYYQAGSPAPGALFHVYRLRSDYQTRDTLSTFVYNTRGQVTRHTSATGGVTDYGYTPSGDLYTVTLPPNNDFGFVSVINYEPDSLGRVIGMGDALGRVTTYTYDDVDRITSITLPIPAGGSPLIFTTTYAYDDFDPPTNLVFKNVTDPNGRVTQQGYNAFGQLVQAIDTGEHLTSYAYVHGLLDKVTDANGNETLYFYDSGRRLQRIEFPDDEVEEYSYTGDDRLATKRDRKGQTISYEYDRLQRLSEKTYLPGGTTVTYQYEGQKLKRVDDTTVAPTDTHLFDYDTSYRLMNDSQGTRGTVTYQYFDDDAVKTLDIPGASTAYTYYPDGSLNTIVWSRVAGSFKYRYTRAGQYESVTFPNGATRNYTYDNQGRLSSLTNVAPGGINRASYSYGYDRDLQTNQDTMLGQRVSMTATVPAQGLSGHQFKYEYDQDYQLKKVTYPSPSPLNGEIHSWTYDAIGNRLTSTVNTTTQTYAYEQIDGHNWQRLSTDGANAYEHDDNGNITKRGAQVYTWNSADRLTGITGVASYKYDFRGRRSSKTAGTTTSYLYAGDNLVREAGASAAEFLFGPGVDEPLAMYRGTSTYYYANDGLGSITVMTTSSGAVQNHYLYDAWGVTRAVVEPGVSANPFRYSGRELSEAGAFYYRARYYLPSLGRFLSEDPLRATDGPSLYAYVINDPVALVDPSGLSYSFCVLTRDQPQAYGDVIDEWTELHGFIFHHYEVRPVIRRQCWWRCYCPRPDVCYIRPHPGHRADHGVSITRSYASRGRTTPQPDCGSHTPEIVAEGICN